MIGFKAEEPKQWKKSVTPPAISQPPSTTTTMSSPTASTTPTPSPTNNALQQQTAPQECISCRVIGTGALAGVGFYALQMSRPKAPGSVLGKRIMGGVGVCFLFASVLRWNRWPQ